MSEQRDATYREAFTYEEALAFAELWKDTPTHSPNPGGLFGKLARYILSLPPVPSETRACPLCHGYSSEHCFVSVCPMKSETTRSETACKATSYAPNGGASQEQRWNCEECGDVTDTDRCPKGRQNETLAKLASVPSATPRSEPTQADLLECYRFWCHYSSLNEGAQDDENEERNKWLEKMEGWAT